MNLWLDILLYSVIDYLGYSICKDIATKDVDWNYRFFQLSLWPLIGFTPAQSGLVFSWAELAAFAFAWATFIPDGIYYLLTLQHWMKKLNARFDDWSDTLADFGNGITHAWFTIVGFFYALRKVLVANELSWVAFQAVILPMQWLIFQWCLGILILFLTTI